MIVKLRQEDGGRKIKTRQDLLAPIFLPIRSLLLAIL